MTNEIIGKNPQISVIVPVYKVEPYLRQCLDSILAQTHGNLEIILVDDGSPDSCPAICDEYAKKDPRIIVIHKENGGLGSARNAGLDACHGEYIGFVDSDDWIEPDMYGVMLGRLIETGCDMASCSSNNNRRKDILEGKEIHKEFISFKNIIREVAWDKLYRREIWDGLRFPEGMIFEDTYIITDVLSRCKSVVLTEGRFYHYRLRTNGLSYEMTPKALSDKMNANRRIAEFYRDNIPELYQYIVLRPAQVAMHTMQDILADFSYFRKNRIYRFMKKTVREEYEKNLPYVTEKTPEARIIEKSVKHPLRFALGSIYYGLKQKRIERRQIKNGGQDNGQYRKIK